MSGTEVVKKEGNDEPKPILLILTGPILDFLASRQERDNPEIQLKPSQFWPFAVAGLGLFGVGLWGGYAFMGGEVPNEAGVNQTRNQGAYAAASEEGGEVRTGGTGRRRGAVVAAEQEVDKQQRTRRTRAASKAAADVLRQHDAHYQNNRSQAVRAATASLGLGTLLALTGAAVAVKATQWYLQVDSVHEFAEKMRGMLPGRAQAVSNSIKLSQMKDSASGCCDDLYSIKFSQMKDSASGWFQRSRLGRFIQDQEGKQRLAQLKNEAEMLHKKGIITEFEMKQELSRIETSAQ